MTTLRSYWQTSSKVFGRGSSSTHENLEKCEFAIRPITAHMLSKAPPRPREMFRTVLIHVKSRTQKNKRVAGLSGWILLWQDSIIWAVTVLLRQGGSIWAVICSALAW